MSMTKKEQAAMEALRKELAEARALRYSEDVEPDIAPPELRSNEIRNGYLYNAYQGIRVGKACTSSIYHAFGQWDKTNSQNPQWLYSTPLLAMRAGRRALEKECAQMLAQVDRDIEKLKLLEAMEIEVKP